MKNSDVEIDLSYLISLIHCLYLSVTFPIEAILNIIQYPQNFSMFLIFVLKAISVISAIKF